MMSWACLALGRFVCAISERRHRAVGAIRRCVAAAASCDAVAFFVPAQAYHAVRRRCLCFSVRGAAKVTLTFSKLMA